MSFRMNLVYSILSTLFSQHNKANLHMHKVENSQLPGIAGVKFSGWP
jgi:hypothetical protein